MTMQIPIRAKDPAYFPEGSLIRSKFTGIPYRVISHKKGMSNLQELIYGRVEQWNSYNNQHFIPADYVSLSIISLL